MNSYTLHITLYDLLFFGAIFIGLAFALLLTFVKSINLAANRLLALALFIMILWMMRILAIDVRLETYLPRWNRVPMQFLLALGPLIYFYVLKITRPAYQFGWKDLLHFAPLLIEQAAFLQEVREGVSLGVATYRTPTFRLLNPVMQLLIFVSIIIYLYRAYQLIQNFYSRLQLFMMDRSLLEFRWLRRLIAATVILWLLWIGYAAVDYFGYRNQSEIHIYYPFYIFFVVIIIWTAAAAFLKPHAGVMIANPTPLPKPSPATELREKGTWLKKAMETNQYFRDPELSLSSLAEKLGLTGHELSRIINTVLKKSFSDFVNEYRVRDVAIKMHDPAFSHITLLGIAFESGFNSKATFNRIFKQVTGKSPAEYKALQKKEVLSYNLRRYPQQAAIISNHETAPRWLHGKLNRNYMFRNYLKTAWRNLLKNAFYSAINIAGLTMGLAVGILVLLWVQDELSFDSSYKKAKDLYRLELWGGTGNNRQIFTIGVAPIGPFSQQQLPAIQNYVRLTGNSDYSLYKYKDKVFGDENAVYADPSLFSMFDLDLIKGNKAKPFTDDNSVVITQKTAEKFFGDQDPIGKVITGDDKINLTVSGVIPDIPKNSSMQYDMVMPISFHFKQQLALKNDLSNNFGFLNYITFLQIKPGSDLKQLAKQITGVHVSHSPGDTDADYLLLPLTKMHLYNADMSDNGITTVRIFVVIAILILVIACINYVNLSTARSMLRAKEISMRKIIGAARMHLFMQFIIETALLFIIAAVFAVVLIYLLMPVFNKVSGKDMVFNLSDYHVWLLLLTAIAATLAASSIYPALLLSSFEPLKALKGKISAGIGDVLFRKILVVTQFTFSIILIIGTIVITGQLNFIRTTGVGYDKTHVITFWMRDMDKHYDAVKAELLKQPGVLGVTRSNQNIIHFQGFTGDVDWDGRDPKQNIIMHPIVVDRDLVSFFKMKLVAGTSFTGGKMDTAHYILNETAIKEMGIKDPIGKRFRMGGTTGTIIGVVKNFHYSSMKEKVAPSIFWFSPQLLNKIYIKTTGTDAPKVLAAAEKQFKQYNGQYPFGYAFLDDMFNYMYQSEQREGTLFTDFAAIAIFISCLGLLGLAAYTAQVRTREIGVRKVLGASVSGIVRLLARDFIKLVFIAIAIAVPLAWYFMYKWLQGFAYKIDITWRVFVLAGGMAILIAFITISFQAVKAALANPVKSLRSE
ncbi:ABC transporter permease [Mucilaginibacter endophyticus]|uniref:ABC transporter permease n=1 Tax=Mucilaginibacter endophyticus TaxID=2675003 RepID=UPI00137A910D|nr:ABC transporter permease [Mucilaginibacter endophyticus]